jgi:hypothetical protein
MFDLLAKIIIFVWLRFKINKNIEDFNFKHAAIK